MSMLQLLVCGFEEFAFNQQVRNKVERDSEAGDGKCFRESLNAYYGVVVLDKRSLSILDLLFGNMTFLAHSVFPDEGDFAARNHHGQFV